MGGVRSFFIESKFFQLVVEEGGRYFLLRIFERGKFCMRSVFRGKNAAQWLMLNIEHLVVGESSKQFFTFREGDIAFTLQRSSNSFGQFLLLTELKPVGLGGRLLYRKVKRDLVGGLLAWNLESCWILLNMQWVEKVFLSSFLRCGGLTWRLKTLALLLKLCKAFTVEQRIESSQTN